VGIEGVVVDAPVRVDGGLVTGDWGSGHSDLELGLARCFWGANIALLPGIEFYTRDRESSLGTESQGSHGGQSLDQVSISF
jgi:hypothetical protein